MISERKPENSDKIGEMQTSQTNPVKQIEQLITDEISETTGKSSTIIMTEAPERTGTDYGIQLSSIAKQLQINPVEFTNSIANKLNEKYPHIGNFDTQGAYLNLKVEMERFGGEIVQDILTKGDDYGKENIGHGQIVVIDMSSPNIAKRMSYPHLRSTIIGDSIANMYKAMGYETVRDNHIGDWGTQFGNLITAIKHWGDEDKIMRSKDPIGELQKLYVQFHTEDDLQKEQIRQELKAKYQADPSQTPELTEAIETTSKEIMDRKKISKDELDMDKVIEDALDKVVTTGLEAEGRQWFRKLETGDPEAKRLWQLAIDLSMKEFEGIYKILGIKFDIVYGESFYEKMLPKVIEEVRESGIGTQSDGALVVDMTDKKLGVAVIQKSDGASVYMTRDIACAIFRQQELHASQIIYVVGAPQKLYFQQLFEILRRLGYQAGENSSHIYFGTVSLPEGKMSTRKGRVILLKDVIERGIKAEEETLKSSSPKLYENKASRATVSQQVAIGALKWNDLGEDAKRDIVFKWETALNMEGYSAPFVQYAGVRAKSILNNAQVTLENPTKESLYKVDGEISPEERRLIKSLAKYPEVLRESLQTQNPSKIARYSYEVAQFFNSFYNKTHVLKADQISKNSRLKLVASTLQVLKNSLAILGIEIPDAM